MRFVHIADIHLGYHSGKKTVDGVNQREQDGYNAFNEAIDGIIELNKTDKVDFVVIAGDLFHSPTPSIRSIVSAKNSLNRLAENGIKVYCLAGNHDSTDAVKDIPSSVAIDNPYIGIYSTSKPYEVFEPMEGVKLHFISHHNYVKQAETMADENLAPTEGNINLLCTHGSCYDSELGMVLHTEAEPREIVIPEHILDMNWDYVLLGHIHERGHVGKKREKRYYAGSLIRRGFVDKEADKGWTEWVVDKNGKFRDIFHPISQRLQLDISFDCSNKDVVTVEDEIEKCFQSIMLDKVPIVRFTFVDIDKVVRSQINWARFDESIQKCLTFVTKSITKEEFERTVTKEVFTFDIMKSYELFWKQIELEYPSDVREEIGTVSLGLLKKGRDKILDKEE